MGNLRLRDLKGLGLKTEQQLIAVGINTPQELKEFGAVFAFLKLKAHHQNNISLNFLYAMIGALENRSWLDIAQNERESILMALEGYTELEQQLREEGIDFNT